MAPNWPPAKPTPRLDPGFQCVQGLLYGYSQRTNAVNEKNVRALVRDLASRIDYAAQNPDASWGSLLESIQSFPDDWIVRFRADEGGDY